MSDLPASTVWAKRYKWRKANGITLYTDAAPIRDHIAALAELDVTHAMVAAASGYAENTIRRIVNGDISKVQHVTAAKIRAVTHIPHPAQKWVPSIGGKRRIGALNAIGWPSVVLAERLGTSSGALNQSINRPYVTYQRWAAIRDLYEALSGTPGPKPEIIRRFRVKPVPPLAWEGLDMDHPATQPDWKAAGIKLADRPVCVNNHEYTPESTYLDTRGHRQCRRCRRAAEARKAAKRRSLGKVA